MAYGTINAEQLTTQSGFTLGAGNASSFKNRIINGAMVIDQRNAGASVTNTTSGVYTLDRWRMFGDQASKFTVQQNAGSVTPPSGYTNYLGATSSSAYSVGAGEIFNVAQRIEGFNTADFAWGTASAASVTLSFRVYSSLTGTFGGALRNSAGNRSYPFSYSVPTANTWTTISITVAGDTSGTWVTNSGIGILLNFSLGTGTTYSGTAGAWSGSDFFSATGATSVVGTNGATFYITGVQLEVGTVATSFDYRSYGTELALCQRYFLSLGGDSAYERYGIGLNANTTFGYPLIPLPVQMRSAPTLAVVNLANTGLWNGTSIITAISADIDMATTKNVSIAVNVASGLTTSNPIGWIANNSTAPRIQFSSEL